MRFAPTPKLLSLSDLPWVPATRQYSPTNLVLMPESSYQLVAEASCDEMRSNVARPKRASILMCYANEPPETLAFSGMQRSDFGLAPQYIYIWQQYYLLSQPTFLAAVELDLNQPVAFPPVYKID